MTCTATLFLEFDRSAREGTFRRLGTTFARFMASLGADEPCVLLCSAVLSELEGRGHTCLNLTDLAEDPCGLLGWDRERWETLCTSAGGVPDSVTGWRRALAACAQVWVVGDPDLRQPVILDDDRLYLRRYWKDEVLVAKAIARRVRYGREVDPARVRLWLDRLFDRDPADREPDWQKTACAIAVRSTFSIITGGPGTGKTYTVARLLTLLYALSAQPEKLRIALAAPTGKAAANLKTAINNALDGLTGKVGGELDLRGLTSRLASATTLHTLLGARPDTRVMRHHAGNPLEVDVLIVDEYSMVHLEMMARILDALPPDAVVIQLGDKDQLASVEAGAVLGDLCEEALAGCYTKETAAYVLAAAGETIPEDMVCGGTALAQHTVMLRKSRRFTGPIGALATAVNAGKAQDAVSILRQPSGDKLQWNEHASPDELLALAIDGRSGVPGGFRGYLSELEKMPRDPDPVAYEAWAHDVLVAFDKFRLLCAVRDGEWGVSGINEAVAKRIEGEGYFRRRSEWYVGRPVMVTRNDHTLGVNNGDIGITLPDPQRSGAMRVYFLEGAGVRSVLATRLPAVETAFAMTVHKAQGAEYHHAVLVLPREAGPVVARELIYTGITRAKEYFTLVTPVPAVLSEGLARETKRASGLRVLLQRHSL